MRNLGARDHSIIPQISTRPQHYIIGTKIESFREKNDNFGSI